MFVVVERRGVQATAAEITVIPAAARMRSRFRFASAKSRVLREIRSRFVVPFLKTLVPWNHQVPLLFQR